MDSGQWTADSGQRTVDSGQWTADTDISARLAASAVLWYGVLDETLLAATTRWDSQPGGAVTRGLIGGPKSSSPPMLIKLLCHGGVVGWAAGAGGFTVKGETAVGVYNYSPPPPPWCYPPKVAGNALSSRGGRRVMSWPATLLPSPAPVHAFDQQTHDDAADASDGAGALFPNGARALTSSRCPLALFRTAPTFCRHAVSKHGHPLAESGAV